MIQELKRIELNNRMERLHLAEKQVLDKEDTKKQPHIVYVMTHMAVSGGVKIILEHANRLVQQGVRVSIVTHFEKPNWFQVHAKYIQVPFTIELAKGIPDCDVIVATYWDHIQACAETGIAPVVYFEQGDFHIFEYEVIHQHLKDFIHKQFEIPSFVFTVSNRTASLIESIYGRKAKVIHNAIDETLFYPNSTNNEESYILMVGAESAAFKRIADIIEAYESIRENYDLALYWITPEEPSKEIRGKVTKCFVQPHQSKIAELYQHARLFVSASKYESFSLPPLEAMACGCPVVTTGNEGVLEYAVDDHNALIAEIGDVTGIAHKIKLILDNISLKEKLISNGLITAKQFKWETIIGEIQNYYSEISSYRVLPRNNLEDWEITADENLFQEPSDYKKFLKLLQVTSADMVRVPVVYHVGNLVTIAYWETVANNKRSLNNVMDYCYSPIEPVNPLALLNKTGYRAFEKREFEVALQEFTDLYNETTNPKLSTIYKRWRILCLYWLQRKFEAKKELKGWQVDDPYYSELYYLKKLLNDHHERWKLSLLGDAAIYPEFLYTIHEKDEE